MKRIILVVLLIASATTATAFGYWASNILGADKEAQADITIGSGEEVITTIDVNNVTAGTLVPVGYEALPDDVSVVTLEFTVEWQGIGAEGILAELDVEILGYTLGTLTEAEIDGMFEIAITSGVGPITPNTIHNVVVTVTFLHEPVDYDMYQQVADNTLTIDFKFVVIPN